MLARYATSTSPFLSSTYLSYPFPLISHQHQLIHFPGWTEYAILKADTCTKIELPKGAQVLDYLNTLGMPGMTAYFVSTVI